MSLERRAIPLRVVEQPAPEGAKPGEVDSKALFGELLDGIERDGNPLTPLGVFQRVNDIIEADERSLAERIHQGQAISPEEPFQMQRTAYRMGMEALMRMNDPQKSIAADRDELFKGFMSQYLRANEKIAELQSKRILTSSESTVSTPSTVQAASKTERREEEYIFTDGNMTYYADPGKVIIDGVTISFTSTENKIFFALVSRRKITVTRAELFKWIWNTDDTSSRTLDVRLGDIRSKLGEEGKKRLITLNRKGYRYKQQSKDEDIKIQGQEPTFLFSMNS